MDNENKNSLLQSIFLLITEQLLIFPFSFAVFTLLDINTWGIYGIFFLLSVALMLVRIHLTSLKRPLVVLIFTVILLVFSLYWSSMSWKAVLIAAFGVFIEIRALALIELPFSSLSFYSFASLGFFGYIIAGIYYNKSELLPFMDLLAINATLSAVFSSICMNMALVSYEKTVGNRTGNIPRLSKKSNRYMLTIFISLMILFTAVGFADRIYAFIGIIINAIFTFLNNIFSSMYSAEIPNEAPPPPQIGEEAAASPFWIILEEIIKFLVGIALIAGVLYLLFLMFRYLKKHYRQIIKKFWDRISCLLKTFLFGKGDNDAGNLGYEDEITSLMTNNESLFSATRRWLKSRSREGRPYVMLTDNVQRARWLYGHIVQKDIKKGFALKRTMTPVQIIKQVNKNSRDPVTVERAISCYNEARYGTKAPDDSGIDALKIFLKK